jgi:hypothetical protein
LSLGFLLIGLTRGRWAVDGDASGQVRSTYLLSLLLVFVPLTVSTLRLPLTFTVGFVLVDISFALALAFFDVSTGAAGLFPIAGIATFLFCVVFAYILFDGITRTSAAARCRWALRWSAADHRKSRDFTGTASVSRVNRSATRLSTPSGLRSRRPRTSRAALPSATVR